MRDCGDFDEREGSCDGLGMETSHMKLTILNGIPQGGGVFLGKTHDLLRIAVSDEVGLPFVLRDTRLLDLNSSKRDPAEENRGNADNEALERTDLPL